MKELQPIYDARQSFYGKAEVKELEHSQDLYSYNTLVASINGDEFQSEIEVQLHDKWDYSQTTVRHVKEFLKQHGLKAETKQQIEKDYS